jgi:thiamine transporter
MKNLKLKRLTQSAVLVALAAVLTFVKVFNLPNGGSITLASMAPIIFASFKFGTPWGVLVALVYSLIQLVTGFYPPPVQSIGSYFLVILLDYILAFGVLGTANIFRKLGTAAATFIVVFLRFICHFLSGITIWSSYAEGSGHSVAVYSLLYNGSYMAGELIVTMAVMIVIMRIKVLRDI